MSHGKHDFLQYGIQDFLMSTLFHAAVLEVELEGKSPFTTQFSLVSHNHDTCHKRLII